MSKREMMSAADRCVELEDEIERLEKLADINADEIQEYQQMIERLQEQAASFEGSFNAAMKEIDRVVLDNERLRSALERIENSGIDVVCNEGREIVAIAREALRDD